VKLIMQEKLRVTNPDENFSQYDLFITHQQGGNMSSKGRWLADTESIQNLLRDFGAELCSRKADQLSTGIAHSKLIFQSASVTPERDSMTKTGVGMVGAAESAAVSRKQLDKHQERANKIHGMAERPDMHDPRKYLTRNRSEQKNRRGKIPLRMFYKTRLMPVCILLIS
jgi:hypothetical protein